VYPHTHADASSPAPPLGAPAAHQPAHSKPPRRGAGYGGGEPVHYALTPSSPNVQTVRLRPCRFGHRIHLLRLGPGRYCSPRHRMPFNSIIAGQHCVSVTWRATFELGLPLGSRGERRARARAVRQERRESCDAAVQYPRAGRPHRLLIVYQCTPTHTPMPPPLPSRSVPRPLTNRHIRSPGGAERDTAGANRCTTRSHRQVPMCRQSDCGPAALAASAEGLADIARRVIAFHVTR
jgi:hypothetical protein